MDLDLSKKERDELRADLASAEPYDYHDPILWTLDGKHPKGHFERWKATMAKKLLEQDEREKKAAGLPLEPESTPASERRARQEAKSSHED